MKESSKLTTILFADIVGYTTMMQTNEDKAFNCVREFKSIINEEVPKHNGNIVQYFGDGCLLSFDSSTEAVKCAIQMQTRFSAKEGIPVRIGMDLGEVTFKDNNAFGSGVNIASRIESIGIPGSVLMSKTVRNLVQSKLEILLVSLGSFEFKNVKEPIQVFAVANAGFVVPNKDEITGKLKSKKSNHLWIITLLLLCLCLVYFLWNTFNATANKPQKRTYQIVTKVEHIVDDENPKIELEEVYGIVKIVILDSVVTGKYINSVGDRISGKIKNNLLEATFMSSAYEGDCNFTGYIADDKNEIKGKYSCSYIENGSIDGKTIANKQIDYSKYTPADSLYITKD